MQLIKVIFFYVVCYPILAVLSLFGLPRISDEMYDEDSYTNYVITPDVDSKTLSDPD